jgi:hypothetical protein
MVLAENKGKKEKKKRKSHNACFEHKQFINTSSNHIMHPAGVCYGRPMG